MTLFVISCLAIAFGGVAAILLADHLFTRHWDSIYDPRSKWQVWKDSRRSKFDDA